MDDSWRVVDTRRACGIGDGGGNDADGGRMDGAPDAEEAAVRMLPCSPSVRRDRGVGDAHQNILLVAVAVLLRVGEEGMRR